MKPSRLLRLALAAVALAAIDRASAASAVAWAPGGHLVISAGQVTERLAKYDALSTARKKYGANVRLFAATGRSGYGAIVVAGRANGQGSFVTIFLGHPSQAEADRGAIAQSLKAGGVNPEVRWRIKG
jgi:hypothetical protein